MKNIILKGKLTNNPYDDQGEIRLTIASLACQLTYDQVTDLIKECKQDKEMTQRKEIAKLLFKRKDMIPNNSMWLAAEIQDLFIPKPTQGNGYDENGNPIQYGISGGSKSQECECPNPKMKATIGNECLTCGKPIPEPKKPKMFPISACCNSSVKSHIIYTCEVCNRQCDLSADYQPKSQECGCEEPKAQYYYDGEKVVGCVCVKCSKPINIAQRIF